jgi:glycosyltransferase involved in cell wall biosynthesis
MRVCYVLLSPTWGMHQYTAGLANRMAVAGHAVHLVTTWRVPRDRYAPVATAPRPFSGEAVVIHTAVDTRDRGFSLRGFVTAPSLARCALHTIRQVAPDVVHITGAHLVNPLLLRALRRQGVPTVHTLHDLHPHAGAAYGRLLYGWNAWVRHEADHLLVHGQCYRDELLAVSPDGRRDAVATGVEPSRVTCSPLTHLFVSYERQVALEQAAPDVRYEPWALFIGRLEAYKGLEVLVEAARRLQGQGVSRQTLPTPPTTRGAVAETQGGVPERGMEYRSVVIAGPEAGSPRLRVSASYVRGPLPANVELRSGLAGDEEAVEWFRRCGLLVLPYVEASQSALVAAAYFFRKPVVVSRVGALPEYVVEGETGWVVPPGDPQALAEVLAAALADPQRLARMGQAGRAWYERQRQAETAALQAMYAYLAR